MKRRNTQRGRYPDFRKARLLLLLELTAGIAMVVFLLLMLRIFLY